MRKRVGEERPAFRRASHSGLSAPPELGNAKTPIVGEGTCGREVPFSEIDSWLLITLAAAISALVVAPAALATPPVMETFTASGAVNDIGLCSFPVQLSFTETVARTNFFDQSGNLIGRHIFLTEQDTYNANGKTLTSQPYSVSVETYFENGLVVSRQIQGVGERVLLPYGGIFIVAGQ